jgi:AcrR family transcriptional regulator
MVSDRGTRQRRANGEQSRRRILRAAVEVAGERGYQGTSIALVSKKSGLPASSIYWHFKDKDELITAVIEDSFETWLGALSLPQAESGTPLERATEMARQVAKALLETPDFLRLGLMLALERRPQEPSARTMFLRVREIAHERIAALIGNFAPHLDSASVHTLTTYAIAAADGLFIAKEIGGDSVDLVGLFEVHARAVFDAMERLNAHTPVAG